MKEWRSASQILHGFLPEQTVDLAGGVWKVRDWRDCERAPIDDAVVRREVIRAAGPWATAGMDSDFVSHLHQNRPLAAYTLDRARGVTAEAFPRFWMCKVGSCRRVYFTKKPSTCKCGARKLGQLHFVGFHLCGILKEPWLRGCEKHGEIAVRLPGTTSLRELLFYCPVCQAKLSAGFNFTRCSCGIGQSTGEGFVRYNVHRASSVYTPQSVVIVNPPSTEMTRRLAEAGGAAGALAWALTGFEAKSLQGTKVSSESFVRTLVAQGISEKMARAFAAEAAASGDLKEEVLPTGIPESTLEEAAREAATVAVATAESRQRTRELAARVSDDWSERANVYRHLYPAKMKAAGLEEIELLEKFPVLSGSFGYTRGGGPPGQQRLVPFKRNRQYALYSDIAETEALLIRLSPMRVAAWLQARGFALGAFDDDRSARVAILRTAEIPGRGEEPTLPSVGTEVLRLVHSYAHRLMRRVSVFAGIDRNALSELLVPHHLSFFVYAAARGDFVLGGLQAVFESEMHNVLEDFVRADHRCPLDPGCGRSGGACMACLHVGEPSCRYFNRFLGRAVMVGPAGYLTFDL